MRRFLLVIASVILVVSFLPQPVYAFDWPDWWPFKDTPDWVIEGDRVYVDGEGAYISVTPHTLTSSGWVEVEYFTKSYVGAIDFVWGFDSVDNVKAVQPQVFENYDHTLYRQVDAVLERKYTPRNVVALDNALKAFEVGDSGLNSKSATITIEDDEFEGLERQTIRINYDSFDGETYAYKYHGKVQEEYYQTFYDWKGINNQSVETSLNHADCDKWQSVSTGRQVSPSYMYKSRFWIDIPIRALPDGTYGSQGKYTVGIKPSGVPIENAWLLDPWWDVNWGYRIKATVDSGKVDADLTNFPILLYLSTSSGIGNTDVSAVFDEVGANSKKIAVTRGEDGNQCFIEVEKWDLGNEKAWLWVSVNGTLANAADSDLYLYYDNTHADNSGYVGLNADGSTPTEAVWDANFKMVYHMADDNGNVDDSTSNNNDGTKEGAGHPAETVNGLIGNAQDFDGAQDYITIPFELAPVYTIEFEANPDAIDGDVVILAFDYTAGAGVGIALGWYSVTDEIFIGQEDYQKGLDDVSVYLTAGTWQSWADVVNADNDVDFYLDGVVKALDDTSFWTNNDNYRQIGARYATATEYGRFFPGLVDEVRISNTGRTAAWIKATKYSNHDNLLTWGAEETAPGIAVSTVAADTIEATTANLKGDVTDDAGETIQYYGFVWDEVQDEGDPGNVDPLTTPDGWHWGWKSGLGAYGENPFNHGVTDLPTGTTIHFRAAAKGSVTGWVYGGADSFLTKPAKPTNIAATDDAFDTKVVVTWNKSTGATGYQVYRDGVGLGWIGDLATYDDVGADAAVITPGIAVASDGTFIAHVHLEVTGESIAEATHHTYTVKARNGTGESDISTDSDTGYRSHGVLTYIWYRSAGDANHTFASIAGEGGTTDPYDDVNAPANGDGRWYYCKVSATGATTQDTSHNRGYRGAVTVVTLPCTGFGSDWAIVNGEITGIVDSFIITQAGFDYGLTSDYSSSQVTTDSFGLESFSETLSGLSPATVYHYRAKINAGGWAYGEDRLFATKGSPVPYEFWNTGGDGYSVNITGGNWTYQTFTTNTTNIAHSVSSVWLSLQRVGSPGTVTASIRNTSNCTELSCYCWPTGSDIMSGTLDGDSFGTAYTWYEFVMSPETCLTANTTYAIVVRAIAGDGSNYVRWQWDSTGGYPGGNAGHSVDSGKAWVTDCPADHLFEVWGNPCLEVLDAKVFTSYINDGDWLVTCLYKNIYPPYYTDGSDISSLFFIQLSDGEVMAQTQAMSWGYQPGCVYLSAIMVESLEWGASNYKVRMWGNFGDNPYMEYALQGSDWMGDDLTRLDSWVRSMAILMEGYYGVTFTEYISGKGIVLNADGGVIFATNIPALDDIRPNIFEIVTTDIGFEEGEFTHAGDTAVWQTMMGTQLTRVYTLVGNAFGLTPSSMGTMIAFLIYACIAALCFAPGHAIAAIVLPTPIMFFVWGTGLAELALMGILLGVAVILLVNQIWFRGG